MKSRWVFRLYNFLVLLALPFILIGVMLRWRKRLARGLERWNERWGRLSPQLIAQFQRGDIVPRSLGEGGWWWVHAVSLGEVKAIEMFLKQIPLQGGIKVLLSLVTPEALSWAVEKQLADVIIAAPLDLPWVVRRVFAQVKPRLFISVESEFWPNLLREARRSGARVALVNGRISKHSFGNYKYIRFLLSVLWDCFDLLAVRQSEDADRFIDLGMPRQLIQVTGNLKYDLPLPNRSNGYSSAASPLTLVVGSSREGEEKELLPVMQKLNARYPGLRVIWAPRHIDRISELESLFSAQAVPCTLKSKGPAAAASNILWDSMGDLIEAYKQADIAIVGGSFVDKGGQNPIEPAALSVPVVFGPSMENFHGIAEVLIQQGGARQVTLAELENCLAELLEAADKRQEMGRRARRAVESRQGATEKTMTLLKRLAGA